MSCQILNFARCSIVVWCYLNIWEVICPKNMVMQQPMVWKRIGPCLKICNLIYGKRGLTRVQYPYSRMRSQGSRFTLGVWGLRVCSLDVAIVAATVRNRPQPFAWGPYGRAYGKFCKLLVASFRVAGVALRDIQTCFVTCRKSFCVAGAILLRRFQKTRCSFRGRRNTLDVSSVILRGRRSTLDVWCCVFFANRIGRAASSGGKVQIPWQAWQFVRCAEN